MGMGGGLAEKEGRRTGNATRAQAENPAGPLKVVMNAVRKLIVFTEDERMLNLQNVLQGHAKRIRNQGCMPLAPLQPDNSTPTDAHFVNEAKADRFRVRREDWSTTECCMVI
eukprot:EG_transcript_60849